MTFRGRSAMWIVCGTWWMTAFSGATGHGQNAGQEISGEAVSGSIAALVVSIGVIYMPWSAARSTHPREEQGGAGMAWMKFSMPQFIIVTPIIFISLYIMIYGPLILAYYWRELPWLKLPFYLSQDSALLLSCVVGMGLLGIVGWGRWGLIGRMIGLLLGVIGGFFLRYFLHDLVYAVNQLDPSEHRDVFIVVIIFSVFTGIFLSMKRRI